MDSAIISYFGKDTIEAAIEDYFNKHGTTPVVRDELITIAIYDEDHFFEIVSDFVCSKG